MTCDEAKAKAKELLAQARKLVDEAESLADEHGFEMDFIGQIYMPNHDEDSKWDKHDAKFWYDSDYSGSWLSSSGQY